MLFESKLTCLLRVTPDSFNIVLRGEKGSLRYESKSNASVPRLLAVIVVSAKILCINGVCHAMEISETAGKPKISGKSGSFEYCWRSFRDLLLIYTGF